MGNKEDKIAGGAKSRAADDIAETTGDSAAKKTRPAKNRKKLAMILTACVLALCVLAAGGYGIWRAATAPKGPVNLDQLTKKDIRDLYREKSRNSDNTPPGLNILLGKLEDDRLAANGSASDKVTLPPIAQHLQSDGNQFQEREWLLTDPETYERLREDRGLQREMQVRALIKLALAQNCERVQYSIESIELPRGGEITTIAEYIAANGGNARGGGVPEQPGYTFVFSSVWASQAIGRDIKSVAATRASFDAFMQELESYEAVDSLVVPGTGR